MLAVSSYHLSHTTLLDITRLDSYYLLYKCNIAIVAWPDPVYALGHYHMQYNYKHAMYTTSDNACRKIGCGYARLQHYIAN